MSIRINKFLAERGIASRRAIDELIVQKRIAVNGVTLDTPGVKVGETDVITIDGKRIATTSHALVTILLNKPDGCISTTQDTHGRKTVLTYIKSTERLFPIGRLDKNTTGVLLLTNDGELANMLMHPRHEVEKVYRATLDKPLAEKDKKRFEAGMMLDDKKTAPCQVRFFSGGAGPGTAWHTDKKNAIVTLHEGRNRQIRRMFNILGYAVGKLDRISYAGLDAGNLKRGEWRHLTDKEVDHLKHDEISYLKHRGN